MAGGKLGTVRIGDESELLANYILEHLAFVTRVPREEDIGVDFHLFFI
ncbi:MAG: hypothetical protein KAR42_04275 [candidate division Zixibacteria bacterium]|nr:hypothetical protein [candidate division Zixibacteria bacterium]